MSQAIKSDPCQLSGHGRLNSLNFCAVRTVSKMSCQRFGFKDRRASDDSERPVRVLGGLVGDRKRFDLDTRPE